MTRRAPIIRAQFEGELVFDGFAGGGGTSTGLDAALNRPPDFAVNHDPEALAMHEANHPSTKHFCESIWEVDGRDRARGAALARGPAVTGPELAEALDDAARALARLAAAPCPFCGGRPNVGLSGMPPAPSVWCPGHECQGISMLGKTVEDAVSAWNRRAPREGA